MMANGTKKWHAIAMVLVIACSGSAWAEEPPRPKAFVTGLELRIDRIAWLVDQMDHSGGIPMPASMMPDLPLHGYHRLSVEISIYNSGRKPLQFPVSEIVLRSPDGQTYQPSMYTAESMTLTGGQMAHQFLNFDLPEVQGNGLHLVWWRDGVERSLARVPAIPMHHTGIR